MASGSAADNTDSICLATKVTREYKPSTIGVVRTIPTPMHKPSFALKTLLVAARA